MEIEELLKKGKDNNPKKPNSLYLIKRGSRVVCTRA